MAFNLQQFCNCGLTESQLLTIRTNSINDMLSGKTGKEVSSINVPGISTTFQIFASPAEIARAANYALSFISSSYSGPKSVVQGNVV